MVGVDECGDHGAGLVDRLELRAPEAAELELAEPSLDDRLALGVSRRGGWVTPNSERRARNLRDVYAEPLSVSSVSVSGRMSRSAGRLLMPSWWRDSLADLLPLVRSAARRTRSEAR
jgi:hypothetical protein